MVVHQHVKLTDDVEAVFPLLVDFQSQARHAGAYDNEPFQQYTEHFLLQVVADGAFFTQSFNDMLQESRFRGVKFQPHDVRRTVEQKAVARHLVVVSVDTVEVTVEEQRQVIALCAQHVHVVQGRQRDDFVFFQMHDYVVYFDVQASVPHPDEFVEAFVTL